MPPEARGPRLGVVAEPELQLDRVDAHPRRVQSAATEGPTETAQLASHRERGLAALDDLPRLVEAKTVYRRRRQVRLESDFAMAGRDAAVRKASRPRHHRIATPVEGGLEGSRTTLREDPLGPSDDEGDDPAAIGRVDTHDGTVAAHLDDLAHPVILACLPTGKRVLTIRRTLGGGL